MARSTDTLSLLYIIEESIALFERSRAIALTCLRIFGSIDAWRVDHIQLGLTRLSFHGYF